MVQYSAGLSWLAVVLTAVATHVTPASAAAASTPLPAPPRGYSTWQWFPGTHWGKGQGQYNAVDEATCMVQAQAMVEKGLVEAVCAVSLACARRATSRCLPLAKIRGATQD